MAHNSITRQCAELIATEKNYLTDEDKIHSLRLGLFAIYRAESIWRPTEELTFKNVRELMNHIRSLSLSQQQGLHFVISELVEGKDWMKDRDNSIMSSATPWVFLFNIELETLLAEQTTSHTKAHVLGGARLKRGDVQTYKWDQQHSRAALAAEVQHWGRQVADLSGDPEVRSQPINFIHTSLILVKDMLAQTVNLYCAHRLGDRVYPGDRDVRFVLSHGFQFLQITSNIWNNLRIDIEDKCERTMVELATRAARENLDPLFQALVQALVGEVDWREYENRRARNGGTEVSALVLALQTSPVRFAKGWRSGKTTDEILREVEADMENSEEAKMLLERLARSLRIWHDKVRKSN